ncbi:hypothetical protein ACFQU7_13305 [Pseudoroseomonas wenyumeiae]
MAHGALAPLDLAPARAMPGVVAALGPGDIPGRNDISPSGKARERLFAEEYVEHWGQPLALVVARTRDEAIAAATVLRPEIRPCPRCWNWKRPWRRTAC